LRIINQRAASHGIIPVDSMGSSWKTKSTSHVVSYFHSFNPSLNEFPEEVCEGLGEMHSLSTNEIRTRILF
jgi:hypothetical protein